MFTLMSMAAALAFPTAGSLNDDALPTLPGLDIGEELPEAIVGGQETSAYPEVVSLLVGGGSCTASLIAPEYVLTAAHCITDVPSANDGVVVWGPNVDAPELTIPLADYWVHPDWNGRDLAAGNDIAIVKLASPAEGMPVVILNDQNVDESWLDRTLTFVGYGITSTGGYDSGIKRTTDNPLVDYTGNLIYAYDPDSGTCQGDSGGPSFVTTDEGHLEQVGITSFGGMRCEEDEHGHTRVDVFIPWILDIAPDALTEPPPDTSGPGGDGSGGPGFLNWGITEDVNGVGGRFIDRVGGDGGGCATAPGGSAALGLAAAFLLGLRRRE